MMDFFTITAEEKAILRELAARQLEYARLPVMAERRKAWYAHNRLAGERPMVVMEEGSFWADVKPPARCSHGAARWLENQLQQHLFVHEQIGDDKVIPDFIAVPFRIDLRLFGIRKQRKNVEGGIGFHIEPVITDLAKELPDLGPSTFLYDEDGTRALMAWVSDVIGDILPPRLVNSANHWSFGITQHVVDFMGMENMLVTMLDEPDAFHGFMQAITDELIRFLRWQEHNGLLLLNNGNDYMGSGSFCFSDELPGPGFTGQVSSVHTWGHLNSQESVGISPDMYHEFVYPYYEQLARQFGLVYYGCCEPVDPFWDSSIGQLPNLRKVSISAWCDEAFMAERLSGSKIIYSRKPSPNFIGVKAEFDAEAFSQSIRHTAALTKNCKSEYIFRDIYVLHGNLAKLREAVAIVRSLTA